MTTGEERPKGIIAGIVHKFLTTQLGTILILLAVCLGAGAILLTPREEEPQIVVPLADVFVRFPGASAEEVEKLVATPLERLLWQIDGVEYVYSSSRRDMAIVTVRFFVGEDRERSIVKLRNKIEANRDLVPPGVRGWVVKPIEIDDVPIVTLTLYSALLDDSQLHRVGKEVLARLEHIVNISRTEIVGGRRREVRVSLNPERMAGLGLDPLEVARQIRLADASLTAGTFDRLDRNLTVSSGSFLSSARDVAAIVVGVHKGRPVYVRDVAAVRDGPKEAVTYTRLGLGPAATEMGHGEEAAPPGRPYPAVTLAIAKKKGTNAVWVAEDVLKKLEELKKTVIPEGVEVRVTRNYGETANQKVNELLSSLFFAVLTVVGLIAFGMGWREGLVVAVAVPLSFALSLFVNYMAGYTINRVTLFALILSLGLVVDDPITNVDNIQRHILMGRRKPLFATLWAVQEVLPPVIMSTLAIIVSFTPMFFITGMMGPYMRPMAINVPLAVTFSTLFALTVVPWVAHHLLKGKARRSSSAPPREMTAPWLRRLYRAAVGSFLRSRLLSYGLLGFILLLLLGSGSLALFRFVPLKMLPFDNKNELQLVLDMPEGTTLERTDAVVRHFGRYLATIPEVTDFTAYVGIASPIDFNGLVRHYYLRNGPHLADIRINLAHKDRRAQQSHAIALRIRRDLEALAGRHGVAVKIVEVPPGPPVISTIVAEIYGTPDRTYDDLLQAAGVVRARMAREPYLVDRDDTAEAARMRIDFSLDKEKAALHGVTTRQVTETLRLALSGVSPATVHAPGERQSLLVRLDLPRPARSGPEQLSRIEIKGTSGRLVPLAELGIFREVPEDQPIYHKNLDRVVYVFGEMAGRSPAEAVIDLQAHFAKHPLPEGTRVDWAGEGEWKITLRVFRDLGLAFGAALIGIYLLVVIETRSFLMPLVIMTAIPLTAIGILPGFWILNLIVNRPVGGFPNPVFFTATGMIGMIALGGIVVRNSIVLIEFIQDALAEGMSLKEAILASGAVRMRPILLTAGTTALGVWPITLDPIFSGLAWALIFGLFASTTFTLLVVPVIYHLLYGRTAAHKAESEGKA
jgi:multidrug efflux pump subunit AcrB